MKESRVGKDRSGTGTPGWCCFRAAIVGNGLMSARNFAKSVFCDVTKLRNARLPKVRSQTDKRVFLQTRDIYGKRFGAPLSPQVDLVSSIKPISSSTSSTKYTQ